MFQAEDSVQTQVKQREQGNHSSSSLRWKAGERWDCEPAWSTALEGRGSYADSGGVYKALRHSRPFNCRFRRGMPTPLGCVPPSCWAMAPPLPSAPWQQVPF